MKNKTEGSYFDIRWLQRPFIIQMCSIFKSCYSQPNLDYDECSVDNGGCSHTCINTLGGHTCECPDGYNMTQDSKTCTGLVHYHYIFLKYIHVWEKS